MNLYMFVILHFIYLLTSVESIRSSYRRCGNVHLTVSSDPQSYIEINWITNCEEGEVRPEYIALYPKNIVDRDEGVQPLLRLNASMIPGGYFKTRIKFNIPWLPGNWNYNVPFSRPESGPHCYPFWVVSWRGDQIIDFRCLGIQPTWMNDNRMILGKKKIGSLIIPGTHNSGSFSGIPPFLENYILNQDRPIWNQLVHGIRYLDFRIGYYENEGYFINHDLVRVTKVLPLFREIRKFLEFAPKEVIILDFHRFPYPSKFNYTLHKNFANLLYQELGDLALAPESLQEGKGPSMNEIWARNKNLIICYSDRTTVSENNWLWDPLIQYWGNTKKIVELKNFLLKSIRERKATLNPLWALMAELTPQPLDLVFRTNNLRQLADEVNKYVTKWIRDEWEDDVNIVATDYFLGNDLVNVAIDINTK
ncbi:PI-PLC X domain-containing protein 1 isoform X2 [Aethina tumida]|uniref:PI-PLC X domain-containing protein 1 isoform X2 n=1 Tax=Aethina tumida TaxID=116153 RepID=UPI002148DD8C|nr:PI-PLC X domain-containing protein 1 isoform X2 [Aethina tumida]